MPTRIHFKNDPITSFTPRVHACTIWHHERIGALVRALPYEDTQRVTKRQDWSFRPNAGPTVLFPEITRPHDASRHVCPLDTATTQKDCFESEGSPRSNGEATVGVSGCRIPIRFRSALPRPAALRPVDPRSVLCSDVHPSSHSPAVARRRRADASRRLDPPWRVRAPPSALGRSSSLRRWESPACAIRGRPERAMDVPSWTYELVPACSAEMKKRRWGRKAHCVDRTATAAADPKPCSADYRRLSIGSNRRQGRCRHRFVASW